RPPVLNELADATILEGRTFSTTAVATDPDPGQEVAFSLTAAPAGATLDERTGQLFWASAGFAPGTYRFTVRASDEDDASLFAERTFLVQVQNVIPVVHFDAVASPLAGTGLEWTRTGFFTDPGTGPWTATVNYGDESGPQPLALRPDGSFELSH